MSTAASQPPSALLISRVRSTRNGCIQDTPQVVSTCHSFRFRGCARVRPGEERADVFGRVCFSLRERIVRVAGQPRPVHTPNSTLSASERCSPLSSANGPAIAGPALLECPSTPVPLFAPPSSLSTPSATGQLVPLQHHHHTSTSQPIQSHDSLSSLVFTVILVNSPPPHFQLSRRHPAFFPLHPPKYTRSCRIKTIQARTTAATTAAAAAATAPIRTITISEGKR